MPAVNEPIHAPEFHPGIWLNSPPLAMKALRGQVVLVAFWDYTCINCLRTLPYFREWWRRYQEAGLMMVGIHTPEYDFAREERYVRRAVLELDLEYPILLDNERRNWHAWANRYWPARYLVDQDGYIVYFHYGEGDYVGSEWYMQLALHQLDPSIVFPPPMLPLRPSDEPGAVCFHATPALHLGYQRGRIGNPEPLRPDRTIQYAATAEAEPDTVYLQGLWQNGPESATLVGDAGEVIVHYRAKEVDVVLTPPPGGTGHVAVLQDDELPTSIQGNDVQLEGDAAVITVDTPRLYNIINNPHHGTHTLRLQVRTTGLSVYAFSFITECIDEVHGEAA